MRRIHIASPTDFEALTAVQAALDEPNPALLEAALARPAKTLAPDSRPAGTVSGPHDGPTGPVQDGPLSVVACTDGGTLVGYAIVAVGETVYLPELAVRPDRQRTGHGSALVRGVCEWYRSRSALRVTVAASNSEARQFYDRLGFESIDRLPDHFESGDALVLARPL